jgi:YggT family protein
MRTVAGIVSFLFQAYMFLIFIRVLLSWVNINPYRPPIDHPLIRILNQVTDPVLQPLRRIIPPIGGTLDISPAITLILLEILRRVIVSLLLRL